MINLPKLISLSSLLASSRALALSFATRELESRRLARSSKRLSARSSISITDRRESLARRFPPRGFSRRLAGNRVRRRRCRPIHRPIDRPMDGVQAIFGEQKENKRGNETATLVDACAPRGKKNRLTKPVCSRWYWSATSAYLQKSE